MDLAAGLGLPGCIAEFSLVVPSRLAGIMKGCLDIRSDALTFPGWTLFGFEL
jgi:hypothetical protein